MQIHDSNLHLKLQEMCDCYLETDYRTLLTTISSRAGADLDEEALRYLGLALMHIITEQATKLTLKQEGTAIRVKVKNDGNKEELPIPSAPLFAAMVKLVRGILHFEGGGGESLLSLGLRSGSVDLLVALQENGGEISLKFKVV
ncbi:MAG: hypothetical protein KJ950_14505 [Proteobacteria bacterium]|nr:hypothetical protein [Pseudomonadota bacterium]MBU1688888.1 hypothetical protein [Pseudomonadota bacterium]